MGSASTLEVARCDPTHLANKVQDLDAAKNDVQEENLGVKIKQQGSLPAFRCDAFHLMIPFLVLC